MNTRILLFRRRLFADFIFFGQRFLQSVLLATTIVGLSLLFSGFAKAQTVSSTQSYQPQYFAPAPQPNTNYMRNSQAFRQEIMRMEINVARGDQTLPITQVPRVQKDDVIKVKLSDETVGGIRPDQSMYDWTFVVAFINPNRNMRGKNKSENVDQKPKTETLPDSQKAVSANASSPTLSSIAVPAVMPPKEFKKLASAKFNFAASDSKDSTEIAGEESVSREINFRKSGWYKEYSFRVPYDSQPVFFLYPKPK